MKILTKEQISNLTGILATASLYVVGFALGGTRGAELMKGIDLSMGAEFMKGIGINLTSNIMQDGATELKKHWLSSNCGALNHDIQKALTRAIIKTLEDLEARYSALVGDSISEEDKESIKKFFGDINKQAVNVFPTSLEKAVTEQEVKDYLYGNPEFAVNKIWERINHTNILDIHHEWFKEYFLKYFFYEMQLKFSEELKTDNKECNRAWRAFQRLLLEGIKADVEALKVSQNLILQDLKTLAEIKELLKKPYDSRLKNEPFQNGLDNSIQKMYEIIKNITIIINRTEEKVDATKKTVESTADYVIKIHDDIQRIKNKIPDEVRIIENSLFINKASEEDIKRYYDGGQLTWKIVGSEDGVIERDAYKRLSEEWIPPVNTINMICIVGDAGEGKSSLAWKFIFNLAQKQEYLILQIKNWEIDSFWSKFENFYNEYQKPFIVLVDNIFRNENVITSLQNIMVVDHIPMTILATSRTNEFRIDFPFTIKKILLDKPNYYEKKRILEGLEKKGAKFGEFKKEILEESLPFLVFMIEATHGMLFDDYIKSEIKVLKKLDETVYQAYQYLCTCYQYEISFSKSLLERLNTNFLSVENEERHPASRGLIYRDNLLLDHLRTRHSLIAKYSTKYLEDEQITILNNILEIIDFNIFLERRFILHLFREMAKANDSNLNKILNYDNIINMFFKCSTIVEIVSLRSIYKIINDENKVAQCTDIALSKVPTTSSDCIWMSKLYREKREEVEALPKIQEWLIANPQDNQVRIIYLGLVERIGTPEQKKKLITDTEIWISANPQDNQVRIIYLGLVERIGTPEQKKKLITDTEIWISANPQEITVCAAYLKLAKRTITPEQKKKVLNDTENWISANPQDSKVRAFYIWLIEIFGTPEQKKKLITDTRTWLVANPQDSKVRAFYIGFVESIGTPEQKKKELNDTENWISANPQDIIVRSAYIKLVESIGTPEQKKKVLNDTENWISANPQDTIVRSAYIKLVESIGTPEQKKKVLNDTENWLSANPNQINIWELIISWLLRENNFNKANEVLRTAIRSNPNYVNFLVQYLRSILNTGSNDEVKDLIEKLSKLIPDDLENNVYYANWLRDHEYFLEAEQLYNAIIKLNPRHFRSLYGYGCLLLKIERYEDSVKNFKKVLEIHVGHALAHDRLAVALIALEKYDEAENELLKAIYWAKLSKGKLGIFYHDFGLLSLKQNRFKDAEFAFQNSILEDPENFANYWHLGESYFFQRDYRNAERHLLIALEKSPHNLGPPASEEIDKLMQECKKNLEENDKEDNDIEIDQIILKLNKKFNK